MDTPQISDPIHSYQSPVYRHPETENRVRMKGERGYSVTSVRNKNVGKAGVGRAGLGEQGEEA